MAAFGKRVLFLGYGAVARCALPLFIKHVQVPLQNVTVLDFEDRSEELRPWTAQGVRFVHDRVTRENLGRLLDEFLSDGDLLVDLAWNIECGDLLEWARRRGVLYVNTSIEVWDPYTDAHKKRPTERTLYWRHMKLRRLVGSWSHSGPTAVLEHGANPGLISHWTKQGLVDLAERILDDRRAADGEAEKIRHWVQTRAYNRLAQGLGVKVIHCSEWDTQVDRPARRRSTNSSTPGASRVFARRGRRRRRWVGARTRRNCPPRPASTTTGRRTKSASRGWA